MSKPMDDAQTDARRDVRLTREEAERILLLLGHAESFARSLYSQSAQRILPENFTLSADVLRAALASPRATGSDAKVLAKLAHCLRLALPWVKGQDAVTFTQMAADALTMKICAALDAYAFDHPEFDEEASPSLASATASEMQKAIQRLHTAVDRAMGDSDLADDESELMLAMQEAARFVGDAASERYATSPPVPERRYSVVIERAIERLTALLEDWPLADELRADLMLVLGHIVTTELPVPESPSDIIERCARVCETDTITRSPRLADRIRALKESPSPVPEQTPE